MLVEAEWTVNTIHICYECLTLYTATYFWEFSVKSWHIPVSLGLQIYPWEFNRYIKPKHGNKCSCKLYVWFPNKYRISNNEYKSCNSFMPGISNRQ